MLRGWATVLVVAGALLGPCGEASAQTTLRVVAYNIKHGRGMDGVVDLERIAAVLRALQPDVVTLQEVDRGTARTDGVDQTARLAELTGMEGVFRDHRPYDGGEYGNAVLTRLPVVAVLNHRMNYAASPISALEVQLAVGQAGDVVSVVSLHLVTTPEERLAEADTLTQILSQRDHPVILAGDFNSRWGDMVTERLREDWFVLIKDGERNTFPADVPDREIDYIMLRPADVFEIVEHRVVPEEVASDHRPLLATLRIW